MDKSSGLTKHRRLGQRGLLLLCWIQCKTVAAKLRQPSPKLRGTVKLSGDLTAPLLTEEECDAFSERTARQLEGDPKAFEK